MKWKVLQIVLISTEKNQTKQNGSQKCVYCQVIFNLIEFCIVVAGGTVVIVVVVMVWKN